MGANISTAQKAPVNPTKTTAVARAKPAQKSEKRVKAPKTRTASSIACSAKATQKGLKGKPRKAFCKKCLRAAAKKTTTKKLSVKKRTLKKVALKNATAKKPVANKN